MQKAMQNNYYFNTTAIQCDDVIFISYKSHFTVITMNKLQIYHVGCVTRLKTPSIDDFNFKSL